MEQHQEVDQAERIEEAAERYWLQGMALSYAKRRAQVEATRQPMSYVPTVQALRSSR